MLLAGKRHVGHGAALAAQRLDHHLGLVRRHNLVLEPLKQNQRTRQPVHGVNGRSRLIERLGRRVRADQDVEAPRLEFVRVVQQRFEIAHAVIARAGLEHVGERGQRRQRREPAGAAAANDEPPRVGLALCREELRGADAVGDVDDTPLPVEPLAVGAAKAGTAAVVHVGDREAAAGPELDGVVESRIGRGHGAAVADDDERRPVAGHGRAIAVARCVVKQLRGAIAVGGKPERFRHRHVPGVDRRAGHGAQHAHGAGFDVDRDYGIGRRGTARHEHYFIRRRSQPGTRLELGYQLAEPAGIEVGAAQVPPAFAGVRHDQPRGARERPRRSAEDPLRTAGFGVGGRSGLDRKNRGLV